MDLLKMVLCCVQKTFSNGDDRVIVPVLLKCDTQKEKDGTDLKENRLQ